jgi:uncharacterized protein (TIGR04255 family)
MQNEWPTLSKPPVDVALFQMKFDIGNLSLADFTRFEAGIIHAFPIKRETLASEINIPNTKIPIGISQITGTSKTRVTGYLYMTSDQKSKIEIGEGVFTYIEERPYKNWDVFTSDVCKILNNFKEALEKTIVTRVSIRFINRFVFDANVNPLEFFKTTISTVEPNAVPYPVNKYAFNLMIPVNENTYSIVKQEFDGVADKMNYIFDIDVLSQQNLIFDIDLIKAALNDLRIVKNRLFFGNVTEKLIKLCN